MFQGDTIAVTALGDGFVELTFERKGDAINKLDRRTIDELADATSSIANDASIRGVLVTSAKDSFIVGADIKEFGEFFALSAPDLMARTAASNRVFSAFEDIGVPSVIAINGIALGGGLEMALSGALRVMASTAKIGLPEVNLGLIPGFGGTVRLPRVASVAVALEWIVSGKPVSATAAREAGVVDAVCEAGSLRETALGLLRRAANGEIDWRAAQARKRLPLAVDAQSNMQAETQLAARAAQASKRHLPAALTAVELLRESIHVARDAAIKLETEAFARVAKTQAAASLVQAFLNDQQLKKRYRDIAGTTGKVRQAAVLGAGVMGGGIACTSALAGVPVALKDIHPAPLETGVQEAANVLARQVKAGRMKDEDAARTLATISPQLDFAGFRHVDIVVEAVVENLEVKRRVLSELEAQVREDTVIASNTSSLRIDDIAAPLARPRNFVGMHFFNPVPVMTLVEIVRGEQTSDAAVAAVVSYALAMRKTPIVVKDCPGFLVNRILTPYVRAFVQLIEQGADFEQIDRVMEAFGWPMGPACLQDVIGMDVSSHVVDVISAGYPARMPAMQHDALGLMASRGRLGQKSGLGFYAYTRDDNGRLCKRAADDTRALLSTLQADGTREFSDQEIVERMMLPVLVEAAIALEEGVVASAAELDTALLLGIGFPAWLGGALKYADWLGAQEVVRLCDQYACHGAAYRPTAKMRAMAASGARYHAAAHAA
ncbi:fatty acid oxidation complex subunit alpha FadB [Paraburkholderia sp. Ac-20340]|uniref:fatty acid oxidation complex subunit alpha FadB n=1 Tax=Paraburkholderia sp. Ac-20340 TaxID=2703888 RepID=UPI00197F7EE6|nr:fatty acid oxidation complex subunit alpha FadB [Paraburkholderia sp. Ac-20340]MBN3854771.1 fatty acid oxidation complex subunit alpha FadB [Paraburkholderia sp. Ac-20340]